MRTVTPQKFALLLLSLLLPLLNSGCTRLPRIDPSGRRLFLPCNYTTTWACQADQAAASTPQNTPNRFWDHRSCLDWLGCGSNGQQPFYQPAYQAPYKLPSCPPSGAVPLTPLPRVPTAAKQAAKPSLQLTPNRIVAPVGSEVILVAGFQNTKSYLHDGGRPINWILSQESVGNFTDVGAKTCVNNFVSFGHASLDNPRFVKSNTLTFDRTIDRGTEIPGDDIRVLRGQAWISMSSASPGTSRVTALAPKIENWPGRQRTATIYWVDAQWQFPSPASVRVGERALLATTLTRQTTKMPIEGWTVRYELIGGPPAGFIVNGRVADATAVEVKSDASGRAVAEIVPTTNQPGTAQVRMTVIRPSGDALSNNEKLAMATGNSSVTWTAPQLRVEMAGPSVAEVGSTVSYTVRVTNQGDIAAENVMLNQYIPSQLNFINSNPPGNLLGNRVQWQIGSLEARGFRQYQIDCQVRSPGQIISQATVTADGNLRSDSESVLQVAARNLAVEMTGPAQVTLDDLVNYQIVIRNLSDQPLSNVYLRDEFDPGLMHDSGPSPVEQALGTIGPGDVREIGLTFKAVQAGQHCQRLTVTADGDQSVQKVLCVVVSPPPAQPQYSLTIQAVGPNPNQPNAPPEVGQQALMKIVLNNTGPTALTNLNISQVLDPSLTPVSATENHQFQNQTFTWKVSRLLPNQNTILEVLCQCSQITERACAKVSVTCDQNVNQSAEACVRVLPASTPAVENPPNISNNGNNNNGGNNNSNPPVNNATGNLSLKLSDLNEGVRPGETINYVLNVKNDFNQDDQNVQITLYLPPGLRFIKLTGNTNLRLSESPDRRTVSFAPIQVLRRGETINLGLETTATATGRQIVRVDVVSKLSPQATSVEEDTTVYNQ